MAISTDTICTEALDEIQAALLLGQEIYLTHQNLCFIFRKKFESDDAAMVTDFDEMTAWLTTQTWLEDSSAVCDIRWHTQVLAIVPAPASTL